MRSDSASDSTLDDSSLSIRLGAEQLDSFDDINSLREMTSPFAFSTIATLQCSSESIAICADSKVTDFEFPFVPLPPVRFGQTLA